MNPGRQSDVNVSSPSIQSVSSSPSSAIVRQIPRFEARVATPPKPQNARGIPSNVPTTRRSSSTPTDAETNTNKKKRKRRVNHTHLVGSPFAIVDRRILRDAPRKDGARAMGSRDVRRLSDDVTKGLYCLPIQLRHRAHILHVLESHVRGFRDVFACVHFICTNSVKLDRPHRIRAKIASSSRRRLSGPPLIARPSVREATHGVRPAALARRRIVRRRCRRGAAAGEEQRRKRPTIRPTPILRRRTRWVVVRTR